MKKIQQIVEEFRKRFNYNGDGNYSCFYHVLDDNDEVSGQCEGYAEPSEFESFLTQALTTQQEEFKKMVEEVLGKQYAGRVDKDSPVWIERDIFHKDLLTKLNQE